MPHSPAAPLRVAYAGTPAFALPALALLLDRGTAPAAVWTQPDRPAGRGRELQASPVKQAALAAGLPVLQPVSLREVEAQASLQELAPDLLIVVAYGLILPPAVLNIPRFGCWNIHASLLPRWRGAAPIQRAIEAGDPRSGVCVMRMEAGLDTGPVFHRLETPISGTDTGGSLHDRLATLGAQALSDCLDWLEAGQLPEPEPQNHSLATQATKLSKAEARLDWRRPAWELERQVRAFNPWPVSWFELGATRLRVFGALAREPAPAGASPGTVLAASAAGLDVAAGSGLLRLTEVQAEGGRRLPIGQFLNAHPLKPGMWIDTAPPASVP